MILRIADECILRDSPRSAGTRMGGDLTTDFTDDTDGLQLGMFSSVSSVPSVVPPLRHPQNLAGSASIRETHPKIPSRYGSRMVQAGNLSVSSSPQHFTQPFGTPSPREKVRQKKPIEDIGAPGGHRSAALTSLRIRSSQVTRPIGRVCGPRTAATVLRAARNFRSTLYAGSFGPTVTILR